MTLPGLLLLAALVNGIVIMDYDGPAMSRNPTPAPVGCISGKALEVWGDRGDTWADNHKALAHKARKKGNLVYVSGHAANMYVDAAGRVEWSRPISIGRVYSCPSEVLERLTADEGR